MWLSEPLDFGFVSFHLSDPHSIPSGGGARARGQRGAGGTVGQGAAEARFPGWQQRGLRGAATRALRRPLPAPEAAQRAQSLHR